MRACVCVWYQSEIDAINNEILYDQMLIIYLPIF